MFPPGQALKEEYFAELNAAKNATAAEVAAKKPAEAKGKPKLKKKAGADDPFASEDEQDKVEKVAEGKSVDKPVSKAKAKAPAKKKPAPKKPAADDFESDDDAAEETRKAEIKALKASGAKKAAATKRRKSESDEEEDENEAPTKKRGRS